jgi:cellulose biosynthesis protein BcsQ
MGTVVTVMNMKGGVGKTTVTMHLAGVAARYKLGRQTTRRILAIDYDPQFNLSQAFLPAKSYFSREKDRRTTIAVLLDNDADLNPFEIQPPRYLVWVGYA